MNVHQIFITEDAQPLPPHLEECVDTVRTLLGGAEHRVYGLEELREFIFSCFDSETFGAFNMLAPYAYKADLARLCLLYQHGGWYVDIGSRFLETPCLDPAWQVLAFRDIQRFSRTNVACQNALIYSAPGSLPLSRAIEGVLRNCHRRHYGLTPLCPTGPVVWGLALAASLEDTIIQFGDFLGPALQSHRTNNAFVMEDGVTIALAKTAGGGDLSWSGAKGTNNYNEFWHSRTVYSEAK